MTLEYRTDKVRPLRNTISHLTYPIQYAVNIPSLLASWTLETFASHKQLIDENKSLRQSQLLLQSELQKFQLLKAENQRLQDLLQSAKKIEQNVLVAEMLAVDMDPYRQNILINKGSRDNVYLGQAVIDASGVMGQISHVSSFSSTALLISDPSHSIPVRVVRNGLRSIATGIGQADQIKLNYIPGNGDIEVGDRLVSSGLGGRFPVDFPVATVSRVSRPAGKPFAIVYAEPTAALDKSHEILLVWQNKPEAPHPLPDQSAKAPALSIHQLALQLDN